MIKYNLIDKKREWLKMRILGIDPGYAIVGWGVVDFDNNHYKTVDYGAITTEKDMEMSLRLKNIYAEISMLVDKYMPDVVAIEELFFNKNVKTAILVAQARGVAITACVNRNVPLFEYTPLQIKQALVGYGRADKIQVQQMVKLILHLDKIPKPDDTADALAVAVCHGNSTNASDVFKIKSNV